MPADDRDWDAPPKPPAAGYDVGYGKPPKATRFQPGTSGNPRGRPRGSRNRLPSASSMERMQAIVLREAYRPVTIRDGDRPVEVPLFQAAMRSLAVNAAKGQPRALALLVGLVDRIEDKGRRDRREAFAAAVQRSVRRIPQVRHAISQFHIENYKFTRRVVNGFPAFLAIDTMFQGRDDMPEPYMTHFKVSDDELLVPVDNMEDAIDYRGSGVFTFGFGVHLEGCGPIRPIVAKLYVECHREKDTIRVLLDGEEVTATLDGETWNVEAVHDLIFRHLTKWMGYRPEENPTEEIKIGFRARS